MKFYLFLFIYLPVYCLAQSNFREGFIIKNSGDTIHGFINQKEWYKTPQSIEFRKGTAKNTETLTVADIATFELLGMEKYERFRVRISQDQRLLSNVSAALDTSRLEREVFLKLIEAGENVNLYAYSDDIKERFYISDKKDKEPRELEIHYYLPEKEVKIKRDYISELFNTAERLNLKTDEFVSQVYELKYSAADFISAIRTLNNSGAIRRKPNKGQFSVFLGTLLARNQTVYTGSHFLNNPGATNKGFYTPGLSAGLNWYNNKHVKRLFFRLEVSILPLSSESSFTQGELIRRQEVHKTRQIVYSIAPLLMYNLYNGTNLKWNAGLGAALNYYTVTENQYTSTDFYSGGISQERKVTPPAFDEDLIFAIPLKTGFRIKKNWEISLNYIHSTPRTKTINYSIHNRTITAGLSYFLLN